ncbi:serine hydrolase [Catenuloplanes japonicus]|uniref:serine hydrolase n=1 Tax=Catenuloplanes japonicus TaxID=33876 RepID=UPI00068ADF13|nr:serine hydrolase [Catenuloplanes japonicus]
MHRNNRLLSGLTVLTVGLGVLFAPTAASASSHTPPLDEFLRRTLDGLAFEEVLDLAPPTSAQARAAVVTTDKENAAGVRRAAATDLAAEPIVQQPQIDATVLELDSAGRIVGSATVLMSPQYPDGVIVDVDRDLHTDDVRWREWDDAGWYANQAQGTVDIVPGREDASLDFMSPYPASVLKLMVAFGVLRLVDSGVAGLDDTYTYTPTLASSLCGPASENTLRGYLDLSLTESSNEASCALIKFLWDHDAVNALNQTFQDLGLETLRLLNTRPENGGRWTNSLTMSSLDTAKLLAIVNGGPGTLWTAPNGHRVTKNELSRASREFFLSTLRQQGWNWMLSTTNWCGRDYPAAGIPQKIASRWIAADGTVTVAGNAFGEDVRPCNRAAEVSFAHKPGWVPNSGADSGIVSSLPGARSRHYIISVFSNLGDQYTDPNRPPTPDGTVPVQYTEKFARLGALIDRYEAAKR